MGIEGISHLDKTKIKKVSTQEQQTKEKDPSEKEKGLEYLKYRI